MKEYSRYKYNIQDNNPPSLKPLMPSRSRYYTHLNSHMHAHTYIHEEIRHTTPGCTVSSCAARAKESH